MLRSGDVKKQVRGTAMITQILTFDLDVKETLIFQSQIPASAALEGRWMLRREPNSRSAIYF